MTVTLRTGRALTQLERGRERRKLTVRRSRLLSREAPWEHGPLWITNAGPARVFSVAAQNSRWDREGRRRETPILETADWATARA